MKSGTTSLHEYLGEHPEIHMSEFKEPSYFVGKDQLLKHWPRIKYQTFWRTEKEYLALFDQVGQEKIIGESSTTYTKLNELTGVAERIHRFNPEAKFIYIMRDPIKRTISHYWHMVQDHDETRAPLDAIKNNPHYCDVSYYAKQIKPYLSLFDQSNIKFLTFEEMFNNPLKTLRDVLTWLEVDNTFVPDSLGQKVHATPEVITKTRGLGILRKLKRSQMWRSIHSYFPAPLKNTLRKMAEEEVVKSSDDELLEVMNYLRPLQIAQTKELEGLLQREFPEWNTLFDK